jgi:sulfite reductase (NADPH) hemoprotein beta-component
VLHDDRDGDLQLLTDEALRAVAARFEDPPVEVLAAGVSPDAASALSASERVAHARWLARNVHAHRISGLQAVTLSLKRPGQSPGDASAAQLRAAADLAERYSQGLLRVTHQQNLVLPWVSAASLVALWCEARTLGFAAPTVGTVADLIACPGGDLCALANARTTPLALALLERYQDLDELHDLGPIDLHMSGCINSCGHHHSGHIGVLGVDKDGREWYQLTLGGTDGTAAGGGLAAAGPGRVIGPAFAADEVTDAIEAVLETYRLHRQAGESFIDAVRRLGVEPFRSATDAVRQPVPVPESAHETADAVAA